MNRANGYRCRIQSLNVYKVIQRPCFVDFANEIDLTSWCSIVVEHKTVILATRVRFPALAYFLLLSCLLTQVSNECPKLNQLV